MALRNRLPILIAEKQVREGRPITVKELSIETGISRQTLHAYINNKLDSFKADVVEKLCRYFKCGPGEFFYLEPEIEVGNGAQA